MKLTLQVGVAVAYCCTISQATQVGLPQAVKPTLLALRKKSLFRTRPKLAHFGDTLCPCIGFDNIEGETSVKLPGGEEVAYPADLGARCEKWDDGVHPDCKEGQTPGFGNGWCAQAWCLVDSCNCDLPVLPKMSAYVADARFRGKPLSYSYHTCGGKDTWADKLPEVGSPGCRCIGFDDMPGGIDVLVDLSTGRQKVVEYPAEIGGTCRAWDAKIHPECKRGKDAPKWCRHKWCYVDPCSCSLKDIPKVTMYLPEATFTGKSLYYSYETCGAPDHFTKDFNIEACVNQDGEQECLALKIKKNGAHKCAWANGNCVGAELVNHPLCKKVVSLRGGAPRGGQSLLSFLLAAVFVAALQLGASNVA